MSYELNVVSKHSEFFNKTLKKYKVNGVDYVGVYGDEPFEIVFKNNTLQRVQVKLSLDGTDILTGKLADTQATGEMWVVEGNSSLILKAWPETNSAGAQFIFTSSDKSVAVNIHGNLESRGVIAAAIFIEGQCTYYSLGGDLSGSYTTPVVSGLKYHSMNDISTGIVSGVQVQSYSSNSLNTYNCSVNTSSNVNKCVLPGVGAGHIVNQAIHKTAGLIQPKLFKIEKIRYQWWNELREMLTSKNIHPVEGFPGETIRIMSIGSTPRVNEPVKQMPVRHEYMRT